MIDPTLLSPNDPNHESPEACECGACDECRQHDADYAAWCAQLEAEQALLDDLHREREAQLAADAERDARDAAMELLPVGDYPF